MIMEKKILSKAQKDKIRILKPIIDDWNRVHDGKWRVSPFYYGMVNDTVEIYEAPGANHVHGILATYIGGVCNACGWTWAIYFDDEKGVYFNV